MTQTWGGNDSLTGGAGKDLLFESRNDDVSVFADLVSGADVIAEFNLAALAEVIDLSLIFVTTTSVVIALNLGKFVQPSSSDGGTDSFFDVDANGLVGGCCSPSSRRSTR